MSTKGNSYACVKLRLSTISQNAGQTQEEIISLGIDEIRPADNEGKYIQPTEFKSWLDEGREVIVLDTRNDYELRVGTFENAETLISSHSEISNAVEELEYDKSTPVVMFCTGGIR